MENKTTIELLDQISKLEIKSNQKDGEIDWDKYGELTVELCKRYPFSEIIGEKDDKNDFTLEERIEELEETVKQLRRHSHHEKSGDVMIRI